MKFGIRFCLFSLLCLLASGAQALQDWRQLVGWTQLQSELGAGLPNGAGVSLGIAEAPIGTNYMPDLTSAEFSGKTIINASGTNNNPSGHATAVAALYFGNFQSIAPGATQIRAYEALDWVLNHLNYASGADPVAHNFRVHNNSWIGLSSDTSEITNISRRVDFVADRDQVLFVGGTHNPGGTFPQYLTHTYNSLIVGLTAGNHATGTTITYGAGRRRPDIVGPSGATSFSTPMVSSAAAMLYQVAAGTEADRSDVMRAILLAGATREEFSSWSRTPTQPMDAIVGAGELNVRNSYYILTGGQFEGSTAPPTSSVGFNGWDYRESIVAGPQNAVYYDFIVPQGSVLENLTISLAWNMQITDTNPSPAVFAPTELLGNLDLAFFDSTSSFLGTLLDTSIATVGNIEFLAFNTLNAGRYTLRVTSDTTRNYALAWRGLLVIPEPSGIGLLLLGLVGLVARRGRR